MKSGGIGARSAPRPAADTAWRSWRGTGVAARSETACGVMEAAARHQSLVHDRAGRHGTRLSGPVNTSEGGARVGLGRGWVSSAPKYCCGRTLGCSRATLSVDAARSCARTMSGPSSGRSRAVLPQAHGTAGIVASLSCPTPLRGTRAGSGSAGMVRISQWPWDLPSQPVWADDTLYSAFPAALPRGLTPRQRDQPGTGLACNG